MRKDNHHIIIKNLTTGKEEGFMLASGDAPYQIQGIDNVAQRVADGEILYSDFTNSRVFAQSDWDGGISKYWWPERTYSVIFPSKKYKDKKNIEIRTGEFTLGGNVSEKFTIPFSTGEGPMCKGETAGVVYMGSGMTLYRSTDFGNTWSVFKDFTGHPQLSDVNEITDITLTDTEPLTRSHAAPMGSITIGNVQALFVAFYNRSTQASGLARYDINFTVRSASGSTFKDGWAGSSANAYGSNRASLVVNTSGLTTSSFQAYKVNNSQEFTLPATWWSLGLFPGQRIKMTRNTTSVVYNVTVQFVGGAFGTTQAIGLTGMPSYDGSVDANNYYTVTEVGKNSSSICLPMTAGGIESFVNVGDGLGQNIVYNNITYTISGLGNGRDYYGNIPGFFPGTASGTSNFARLTRIDGGDAWTGIFGNGSQTFTPEKWVYKYGTYLNKITKFVNVEKESTHIWGYNHLNPTNKFYDVAYGETTTNASYSNIYANSLNGVLHSAQNHTITFNSGDCPTSAAPVGYAEGLPASSEPVIYVGTQFGSDGLGTQASLFKFTLNDAYQTAPTYAIKGTVGAVALTSMVYFASKLYIGSRKKGMVYEWDNSNSTFLELAQLPRDETTEQAVIDYMTTFAGKIVCSYQKGSGVYTLDPNTRTNDSDPNTPLIETDVLCAVETLSNARIYRICNTGGLLLFTDGVKIYSYDQDGVADQGYMESSIYGGYISNVDKQWVYAYVRVGKWTLDDGQRLAMQVSLDEGVTWNYCPTEPGKTFSPTNAWDDTHSIGFNNIEDHRKQQAVFYFPYYSLSGTILYRCWLKKGTTVKPFVNHIGLHYYLNYKQELFFNYQLDLNKSIELLGGRTIEKDLQFDKLQFLKDIWNNQYQVEVTDVTGIKYICVPYSDDRTPGQGLIISTSNSNTGHLDLKNLTYKVALSLKTIANYQKIL